MEDIKIKKMRVGDIVTATVVSVKDKELLLDLNYMTEGTMYLDEYSFEKLDSFKNLVKIGDVVTATVKKISERDDSVLILLSRKPILKLDIYEEIKADYANKKIISARVKKIVPKGLIVSYKDYEFFLHENQIEFYANAADRPAQINLESYKNMLLDVNIIELDEKNKKMVVSRREHLKDVYYKTKKAEYEEMVGKRNAEKAAYKEAKDAEYNRILVGDVLTGTVFKIEKYGVFVKFDVCHGLIRMSQLSHHHVKDANEIVKIDDKIEVKVIKKEEGQIDLSLKALIPTPYQAFAENHKVGSEIEGKVIQKLPFGIIFELAEDVTGFLHKSEYAWNPNSNLAASLKIGDKMNLIIINIDIKKEKINLSKKAMEDNPWGRVTHQLGDNVEAKVIGIVPGKSLLVEVQEVEGVILFNELSNEKISKIEDYFAIGDIIKAKIVELNKAEWVLSLSIKRLLAEEERKNFENYIEKQEASDNAAKTTLGDVFKDILEKK